MNLDNGCLVTREPGSVNQKKRGRLKIFLGYCAGVGKTYRMLQEGINSKENGVTVAIGIVETHGRVDTEFLADELDLIPRKQLQYAGLNIDELDLDAILKQSLQLVLIDELAHNNAPGSRHAKRYQDVEELLNAGIDVYTTLNIQHIQSLGDIVCEITGVRVEETVPAWFVEQADEVELVDLSPEKLQQRLAAGKVYIPQKAKVAAKRFFKKGNLLALRELSLKYTAKRVDTDLILYREQEEISKIWPVKTKILVGIGDSKSTEGPLLAACRLANDLAAEWYALHVESIQQTKQSVKARHRLYRNINLAEELGARVVVISGNDVIEEIVKFTKQKNITLIIVGFSRRFGLRGFFSGSIINRLLREASPANVLVVDDSRVQPAGNKYSARVFSQEKFKFKPYLIISSLSIVIGFLLKWVFPRLILPHNLLMILLLPTLVTGILSGVKVGLFTAGLSLAFYDFFAVPPLFSFAVTDLRYLSNMVLFVLITVGVSIIGKMIRWRADSANYRERFVYALYNFSREIIGAEKGVKVLNRAIRSIAEVFEGEAIILLPGESNLRLSYAAKSKPELELDETEQAVAMWVYQNGHHAGRGTNTLSSAAWYYVPLKVQMETLGVICLSCDKDSFSPEQRRLFEAFAGVVALALASKDAQHLDV